MNGKTIIYDDVFIALAKIVLESAEEVFFQEKKGNLSQFFGDKNAKTGITIRRIESDDETSESGTIAFDLKLSVLYGVSIPETLSKIREVLCREVQSITGYQVETVDIAVERVIRMDKLDASEEMSIDVVPYAQENQESGGNELG